MEKQKNIPQLRFPEFEGEWETKTLNSNIKIMYGKGQKQVAVENGKYPILGTGGIMGSTNKFLYDKPSVLIGRKGTIDKPVFMDTPFWTVDTLFYTEIFRNTIPKWLYYKFQTINWYKFNEASGVPSLSSSTIYSIKIKQPVIEEQTRIASFLTAIDKKITELKRKKTLLEQYKKGVMQKLFSQELRFKDDDGKEFPKWEMKKLGEIAEIIGGGTPETNNGDYWNGSIQWFTPTEIKSDYVSKSQRTITELGLRKSSANLLPKGAILLTTRATIGEASIALEECTTNQGFQSLIVNETNNNIFIFNWIKENKAELLKRASGSTFPEISKSEIKKIVISVPNLVEQTKIANFLSAIDEKINHTQIQIQQTEQYKKGLLQQMFV
jgi:type I restriction enzyme S subunit